METPTTIKHNETDPWERWYKRVLDLIIEYDIDMWSYINCDWDSQPMWHGVGFHDSRLSSSLTVMQKWQQFILDGKGGQHFLMGGSLGHCSTQTKLPTKLYVPNFAVWGIIVTIFVCVGIFIQVCRYMAKRQREQGICSVHTSETTPLTSNTTV